MTTITMTRKERIQNERNETLTQFLTTASLMLKGKMLKAVFSFAAAVILFSGFSGSTKAMDDVHVVKQGETLYALSKTYKVSVQQLKDKNVLSNDTIKVGQELYVPMMDEKGNHVAVGAPLEEGEVLHKIQAGETLYSIAKKYGVSVAAIVEHNYLPSTNIIAGRNLKIPGVQKQTQPVKESKPAAPATAAKGHNVYKVQAGDTLYSLAKRFGSSVSELRSLNGLKYDAILIGQSLKLPNENIVWSKARIVGAVDSTSIEVIAHHVPMVLEVSFGSAEKYNAQTGREVTISWKEGNGIKRPALISVQ